MARRLICLSIAMLMVFAFAACNSEPAGHEFMDDKTIVVVIDNEYVDNEYTIEDFSMVSATEKLGVKETSYEYAKSNVNSLQHLGLMHSRSRVYAIKIADNQNLNAAVNLLKENNFVADAWVNQFNYKANVSPAETKVIWEPLFHGLETNLISITIDRNFVNRLFTIEDFKDVDAVYVDAAAWNNVGDGWVIGIESFEQQDITNAIKALEKLCFVQAAVPVAGFDLGCA